MTIPAALLRRFYVPHTLRNSRQGFEFTLRNSVAPTTVISLGPIRVNGTEYFPNQITLIAGRSRVAAAITTQNPFSLPLGQQVLVSVTGAAIKPGPAQVYVDAVTKEIGSITFEVTDSL